MINFERKTWEEINIGLASRLAQTRRRKKITQKELATRSGVSLGSIKRFEQSGEISLQALTKITIVLGVDNEIEALFSAPIFTSIEEIINGQNK